MEHTIQTNILDGKMSLSRSNITEGTLTVNGQPIDTQIFTVDYLAGTIERIDQNNIDKELYEISFEWEEIPKTYDELRQTAPDGYGDIGDQLDMMYWDLVNGTDLWKQHIATVKDKYPKPE